MKIVVTSTGPGLDAQIDPRFGRCQYFVFVETDDLSFEVVENPNIALGGGAGIQSAQVSAEKGGAVVLTGNCGPNAYQTLAAAGVQVIVRVSGSVREVVEQFKAVLLPWQRSRTPRVTSAWAWDAVWVEAWEWAWLQAYRQ